MCRHRTAQSGAREAADWRVDEKCRVISGCQPRPASETDMHAKERQEPSQPRTPSSRASPSTMSRRNLSAYDNKLVASTLSSPPGPPGSGPSAPGTAGGESISTTTSPIAAVFPALHHVASSGSFASTAGGGSHPSLGLGLHSQSYGLGIPVTRSLSSMTSSSAGGGPSGIQSRPSISTVIEANSHPSHPTSPWSVLTLHILPVFNGVPLTDAIEDLK
jgi:hypothetical protein